MGCVLDGLKDNSCVEMEVLGLTPMLQPQQVHLAVTALMQGRTVPLQYGRWVQWDLTSCVEIMHTYRYATEGMDASRPASSSQNGHAGGWNANGWHANGHGKAIHADAWTTTSWSPTQNSSCACAWASTNKPTTTDSSRACAMEAKSWWSTR